MFKNRIKLRRDREGAILAFVVILFLVISIIASSVALVFSSNLKLAKHQEDNMRAHYLVHSGIEATLSTLLNPLYVEDGVEKTIIDKIKKDNIEVELEDDINIDGDIVNITVDYIKDKDEINIKSSTLLNSGDTKEISLRLEWSGDKFKTRWN